MQWTWRFITLALLIGLTNSTMAAEPLPTLTGDWYYRGTPACVPCILHIDKQTNGQLEGRIFWADAWTKGSGTAKWDRKGKHVDVKMTFASGNYVELVLKKNKTSMVGRYKAYADHGTGWIVEFSRRKPGKK